jgi:hypothetical protein
MANERAVPILLSYFNHTQDYSISEDQVIKSTLLQDVRYLESPSVRGFVDARRLHHRRQSKKMLHPDSPRKIQIYILLALFLIYELKSTFFWRKCNLQTTSQGTNWFTLRQPWFHAIFLLLLTDHRERWQISANSAKFRRHFSNLLRFSMTDLNSLIA